MRETWKPVIGWSKLYEVSNLGRVRRSAPGSNATHVGRVLSAYPSGKKGYLQVSMCRNGVKKNILVAGLVARAFHGRPAQGLEVNHIDGNRTNNRASNLEWGSRSHNQKHAYEHGLKKPKKGEAHWKAKLTEDDVREIRLRYKNGESGPTLAEAFDIDDTSAWRIATRRSWKHIE